MSGYAQTMADKGQMIAAVPASGYAPTFITLMAVDSAGLNGGQPESRGIGGVTVLVTAATTSAVTELWLPELETQATPASGFTSSNYHGPVHSITGTGSFTHPLAAWPGAQIRCKGGGTTGNVTVYASACFGPAAGTLV
jgi:hypothetical protein